MKKTLDRVAPYLISDRNKNGAVRDKVHRVQGTGLFDNTEIYLIVFKKKTQKKLSDRKNSVLKMSCNAGPS